jgi:hypothetical protein
MKDKSWTTLEELWKDMIMNNSWTTLEEHMKENPHLKQCALCQRLFIPVEVMEGHSDLCRCRFHCGECRGIKPGQLEYHFDMTVDERKTMVGWQ